MENPLHRVMRELGISAKQAAMISGLNYTTISAHLNGMPSRLSPSVAHAFIRYGYSPEQLRHEYNIWRNEEAQKLKRETRCKFAK